MLSALQPPWPLQAFLALASVLVRLAAALALAAVLALQAWLRAGRGGHRGAASGCCCSAGRGCPGVGRGSVLASAIPTTIPRHGSCDEAFRHLMMSVPFYSGYDRARWLGFLPPCSRNRRSTLTRHQGSSRLAFAARRNDGQGDGLVPLSFGEPRSVPDHESRGDLDLRVGIAEIRKKATLEA